MSITWPCRLSVAEYAALGRRAPVPRRSCSDCSVPMALDGSYRRKVREAGVVHEIVIRMVACSRCGRRAAMLPDFVVKRRLDSTLAIGAALLAPLGVELPAGASALYVSVPQRTRRSWRQRFAERSEVLTQRFLALTVHWGGHLPFRAARDATSEGRAVDAIGLAWRTANRRPTADIPPAWRLANVIVGSQLLGTRVDLPWPVVGSTIGHSRAP